jgi:ribose transport system substrate-binding protein
VSADKTAPTPDAHPRPTFRIGVLYWSENIPGQVAMRRGLEAEADAINARTDGPRVTLLPAIAGDGEAGRLRQIEQMKRLLAARPDAIIVQPTDNDALTPQLREANTLGVPVVAFDQYISGGRLDAYITSDNRQAGTLDGEYIAARFPDDHVLRLVLVEYPRVSSTVERLDGFLAALRERGQPFTILGSYEAVEPQSGRVAGRQILADFPVRGSVDVVFTVNDGGGLAVVDTLAGAGRDEILVATIDGDPESVANITAGRLTVIDSAQFCGPIGASALRAALALLTGQAGPIDQMIPTFPVTRETLTRYPGWMGPLPPSFSKPWDSATPVWSPEPVPVRTTP